MMAYVYTNRIIDIYVLIHTISLHTHTHTHIHTQQSHVLTLPSLPPTHVPLLSAFATSIANR